MDQKGFSLLETLISQPLKQFLANNELPKTYLGWAHSNFSPIVHTIIENHKRDPRKTQVIGINGSQGSGKSTLASYLCTVIADRLNIQTIALSLDDFYLTKSSRKELAKTTHKLLETRGVPGTHDTALAISTIESLLKGKKTVITRFDKSRDDRFDESDLLTTSGNFGLIVIEGWCFGAKPQSQVEINRPINDLEKNADPEGVYRNYVNKCLAEEYQSLFAMVDYLVMLKAPSFSCVFKWRLEQENKLRDRIARSDSGDISASGIMSEIEINEFIQYFQRITEVCISEMPSRADFLYELNEHRDIKSQYSRVKDI